MASLRDTFSFADPGVSQQGLEELQVQNMGTLRKGYEGGDIGTDANAAAAQLSTLRANGQHAEADALQTELTALQQRRSLYAPEIGGVENIRGVGDAATWALENVGQGAASMQDPILATTAMNAGGRLLGMSKNPIAQLASKALSWGAPAAAYGMNHEQLKGEFVQSAMRDPELMARTSWQDLNQTANVQALGGAALDTMLPTVLGRQLAGKKGMAALSKMAPTSFGGRTLATMGLEGATEVGQTMGSQYALGHLNPNRVTSGDFMENVNAGLGGMVGAGPLAAVGAAAQGGHERLGGVADALGKKAGDTVDLATGAVDSAKEKGRSWWDRLTGGKKAEDLQDGEGAQALDPREIDVLLDKHLDPQTATDEDFLAADVERTGIVVKHLRTLAETNDRAADLLGRVMDPGAGDQVRALDESANFLKEHYNVEELDAEGNNLGRSLPSKGAELAGRAAKGIVKGAAKVAGDMISGAARGLASKKNLQADEGGSTSYTLADWEATQSYRRAAKHVALSSTKAEANSAEQTSRMNLAARQAAEFARTKYQGKEGLARMASHTAFELIDASRDFRRSDVAGTQPGARNARLGRVADTMRRLYGAEDAMKMADTIASIVGQDGNKYLVPAAEYVKAEIQRLETPAGRIQAKQERQELAGKLASLVPPQRENFLLDKGINIRGQDADHFVRLLEKLADGTAPRDTRRELNRLFGAATVNNLLAELNQQAIATGKKETFKEAATFADAPAEISEQLDVNDDGEVSSDDRPSDYDERMGSKKVERGASGMMVAFDKISTTMSKGSGVDVFSGTKDGDTGEVKRPWLFKKGQKLFNGGDAIKNRIANLRGELKGRADSYKIAARSAWDVMTEDGVQPGRVVAAYRDYLLQEAAHDERRSKPQYTEAQLKAMRLEAMDAAKYVLDTMTPPKKGDAYRLPVGRRREIARATKKFFQERFVVTAESPSDRVSNRIDLDELNKMISATKKAVDKARMPDQDEAKILNENNIISFTRRVKGEDKPAHIRADDLMKWGRNQRLAEEEFTEQSDFSNDNANDQYIADLMSGITAVMDSGFVRKKMPTKLNMKGKIESFADGIPPSLRLATTTQGKRNERRDEWLQGFENQRPDGPHFGPGHKPSQDGRYLDTSDFGPVVPYEEREVAPDQARSENDRQTSVSDVDVKPDGFIQSGDNVLGGMMPGFPTQDEVRKSRETLRARMEANGELSSADPREAITVSVGEKKSDRKNVVPSETERQRETDDFGHKIAEDEFSDQRYRSRVEGFKPDANLPRPKSVMRAYADANRDAAEIVKALTPLPEGKEVVQAPGALGRPAEGFAMLEARLRAAVRPTEGGGLLGGMHFILPVLKVLNGDKLGTYDFSPEEAVKATELRGRAALAILGSKLPVPQRVRMAKELATAVAAERITKDNANTALWRIAQLGNAQAAPEVAAQEAPKSQARPSGAGGVDLGTSGPYTKKDQAKSDQATKFIGRGSERSSTAKYAKAWGDRANTGQYTAEDVVFISAEGNRGGRVAPDFAEIGRAVKAGATVITDSKANRERDFNVGEREVAKFLTDSGYREVAPGRWQSAGASIANRARHQGVKIVGTGDPTLAAASDTAAGRVLDEGVQAWRKGVTYKQFLASPEYLGAMHGLMVHKLMGTPGVQTEIDELNARAHQMFAIKYDKELEAAVMSRLSATDENTPAKLRDMMREILVADVDPATKVIARAVNTVAGDVDVIGTRKADIRGNSGVYNSLTKVIRVAEDADLGHAGTVLHEGVHAATVAAVIRDKGLHRAVYRLMDHVIEQNPRLRDAYGLTNSLEFLAEGLGNISFQRELAKIKPNDAVARYLGKTVANAWDAFVGMVRTALNLDPKHESALAQLLDLGGRAMLATKANPSGLTHAEFETFVERGVAPEKRARELADAMVNSRQIEAADRPILRQTLKDLVDGVVQDGLVPHKIVVAMATTLETFNLLLAGQTIELGSIFTALDANINSDASAVPSKAGRKLNAQSNEIHDDLGRPGFAATHDSPIRHEGKFDWRAHQGKGEGNAAFGAGTYLSTANGVHKSYKEQFTAALADTTAQRVWFRGIAVDALYDDETGEFSFDMPDGDVPGTAYEVIERMLSTRETFTRAKERIISGGEQLLNAQRAGLSALPNEAYEYVNNDQAVPPQVMSKLSTETQKIIERFWNRNVRRVAQQQRELETMSEADFETRWEKSPTYQVSVNIAPEQLLDWNKPLSEQSEAVQKALAPWIAATKERAQKMSRATGLLIKLAEREGRPEAMLGEKVYYNLTQELGSQTAASDYLQSLGILGHQYAASGGTNDTHPNYVIYDDSKITTNYVHFNQQDARTPRDTPASPEEIAKAKAWMNKVLPKVRVEFEKLTGYSGEFIEAENLVKISTTAAAGVMQTAYHEGLHAFFAGLAKNPKALRVLMSIVGNDDSVTVKRLYALLAKYPAAKAQLVDGEERLAYAFQFWAAGKLQLPVGPARGFFAKLRKFFRQVAGLIKDEERAADIFQAFNDGKLGDPSTAGKVLNDILAQGTWTKKNLKRLDGLMQRVRQLIMPAEEILMRAPSAEAKALARQLFTNPGDEGSAGMQEGLLNAQRTTTTKEMNRFANAIAGLDDKDMANVAKLLEDKTPLSEIPYAPYLKAVKEIRQQLKDFHTYMQDSTMEMGTVKDDYFPRVWSLTKLIDDREGFVKMLMDNYPERLAEIAGAANLRNTKHGKLLDGAVEMDNKAAAEEITNYLIKRNGTDGKVATQREDGVLAPYFAAGEKREFAWIETQKSEPWQNKNLIGIMTGYLHEGVRSAEYTRRFGRKGEHLDASLRTIEAELTDHARAELAKGEFKDQKAANAWVTRQMRGIRQSVGAMEGSLGKDISDRMRKFNSWMMVYQNVRLLPLTLFASVVDPMGMIARGATMREAFEAFQRGIQEVFRGWADLFRQDPKGALSDKWTKLAEHIGAVDAAILSHHASEEYSSTYLSHGAKQINDAFFKINGMEAWNRGMRVGAVKSAAAFIARHKALPEVHSQRWLTELGLTPDQITLDGEGNLITDMQDLVDQTGVSKTEAKRQIDAIHAALNRWTLSAVLTPNAAQRPAWSSDPHYSLFFHLKQFSYSFHQTILKRAVKEMNYGNMGPIAAFAGYIPVMLASDLMKGLIVGGGELPAHMKGMDLGDHLMHAINRTGTLGIAQIGVDASHDMFSVLGPGVEQLVDGITEPIADTTLRAMPLNPLVRAMAE